MSGCHDTEIPLIKQLKELFARIEKLESLTNIKQAEQLIFDGVKLHATILQYEARMKELEKLVKFHEEYLTKINQIALCDPEKVAANQKRLAERLDKLEQYMEMEDRVTASYVLDRLTIFETNIKLLTDRFNGLENFIIGHKLGEKNLANRVQDLETAIEDLSQDVLELECKENKSSVICPVCDGKGRFNP